MSPSCVPLSLHHQAYKGEQFHPLKRHSPDLLPRVLRILGDKSPFDFRIANALSEPKPKS